MVDIGKIERVPLRSVWPHEAYNFTTWLEESLEIVNEALGLSLQSAAREQSAGSFSVDLVAEDEGGDLVVIENQLEKSNHDHLGKVLTYLVAVDAKKAIWLVADPRPEHVQAVAWLNESSSADFYLVKVEAIRIGKSEPAPLLTLITGPSEEARLAGRTKKELAERNVLRKRWWSQLLDLAGSVTSLHSDISPSGRTSISARAGHRGLAFNYTVTQYGTGVQLYVDFGKGTDRETGRLFEALLAKRSEIEDAFGESLDWDRTEGRRACVVGKRFNSGGYRSPEHEWDGVQREQVRAMASLGQAVAPVLEELKSEG